MNENYFQDPSRLAKTRDGSPSWMDLLVVYLLIAGVLFVVHGPARGAEEFRQVGARARGMGGAGVANISDENFPHWNPAMGNSRPKAREYGLFGAIEVQATNDILAEVQDLENLRDDIVGTIEQRNFSDTAAFSNFLRIIKELEDVNQPGQGILGHYTFGGDARRGRLAVGLNQYRSVAAGAELDLENVLIGTLQADSAAIRQFVTGLKEGRRPTDVPTTARFSETTINRMETVIQDSLNELALDLKRDLGFEDDVTADSLAREIAFRAEQGDPDAPKITDRILRQATEKVLPELFKIVVFGDDGFDTNAQNIVLKGAKFDEITVSYSIPWDLWEPVEAMPLQGGIRGRFIKGSVSYGRLNIFRDRDLKEQVERIIDREAEESTDLAVDVGLLLNGRKKYGLQLGLVGKNLLAPGFDYPDVAGAPDELGLKPQWRAGLGGYPLVWLPGVRGRWWTVAADYDLTVNSTLLDRYRSQYLALGSEVNIMNRRRYNLAVRLGWRKNMVQPLEGELFSFGIGVNVFRFHLDLSATISDKSTEDDDGDSFPSFLGASLNLSGRF